jgi:putative ABC transport system permease protein
LTASGRSLYDTVMRRASFIVPTLGAAGIWIAAGVWLPWWLIALAAAAFAIWLAATGAGRRTGSITAAGIATLPQRLGGASVALVGIAGVVGVLVALLAMGNGFKATLQATGSDDTAIVLNSSAPSEVSSALDQNSVKLIGNEPQVMRDAEGRPIASPELLLAVSLADESNGLVDDVSLRGVGPEVWALRPNVKMIAGRRFHTGLRELIVGKYAAREFAHTSVGSTLDLNGEPWKVVGEFDSADAHNSELWADSNVVAATFQRGSSVNAVTVRLGSAKQFATFKAALASDPQLNVRTNTTRAYYGDQAKGLTKLIRTLGSIVAAIMGIGAVAGALNSMYSAVSARTREIATLRAIGFRGAPVVVSVMIETMLLALAGGAVGAGVAWLLFDNYTASTIGANYSEMVFQFRVSPALLGTGLRVALVIGFLGGLLPALRAARMPVADALRKL